MYYNPWQIFVKIANTKFNGNLSIWGAVLLAYIRTTRWTEDVEIRRSQQTIFLTLAKAPSRSYRDVNPAKITICSK
jgi:hypothetical protein